MKLPLYLPVKYRFQLYIPTIVWAGFIFYLSSKPPLPGPPTFFLDFVFKKLAHMFVYFVLYYLVFRSVQYDIKNILKASLIAFIITIAYGISDEVHQSFVPGRTPTGKDVLFDLLGISIAWLSIYKYI